MIQKRFKTIFSLGIATMALLVGTSVNASASNMSSHLGSTTEQSRTADSLSNVNSVPAWLVAKYNAQIRLIRQHNANPPNPQDAQAVYAYNARARQLNAELAGIIAQIKRYTK